jgi:hypothetical protein
LIYFSIFFQVSNVAPTLSQICAPGDPVVDVGADRPAPRDESPPQDYSGDDSEETISEKQDGAGDAADDDTDFRPDHADKDVAAPQEAVEDAAARTASDAGAARTAAEAVAARTVRDEGGFVSASTLFPPFVKPVVEDVGKVSAPGDADGEGKDAPIGSIPEKSVAIDADAEVKDGPSATGQDIGKIQ